MRKLTFFVMTIVFAMLYCCGASSSGDESNYVVPQSYGSYSSDWKKVESFENEGKPRSALEIVEKIYGKSLAENNAPQIVKSLMFRTKFLVNIGEKELPQLIKELEDEALKAKFPANAVLKSMVADVYWNYFNRNRYRFYNRTDTEAVDKDDIATWSLRKIFDHITKLHIESLENKDNLRKIKIDLFDEIVNKGTKPETVRPALYDLIAHRAFDFFSNSETQLTEPSNVFVIDSPDFFGTAEKFVSLKISGDVSASPSFHAFKIIQDLTVSHVKSRNIEALIDVELARLNFVKQKSVVADKEKLFFEALLKLQKQYEKEPSSDMVRYEIAKWHRDNSDETDNLKIAVEICSEVIKSDRYEEAVDSCRELLSGIFAKQINITTESVNIPDKPFRMLVSYKNVRKLHLKILPLSSEDKEKIYSTNMTTAERVEFLASLKHLHSWDVELPGFDDHKDHSTETKIPPLEIGDYIILAGTEKTLNDEKGAVVYAFTTVSNIAVITKPDGGRTKFFVTDRDSGSPIDNATITIFKTEYDRKASKLVNKRVERLRTDKDGISKRFLSGRDYGRWIAVVEKDKDKLEVNYPESYRRHEGKLSERSYFFTDRAIYRPGQTVYFKGIMMNFDSDKLPQIIKNRSTTVDFFDVNRQKISSLSLKTNDFGSFEGSFTAPANVLGGQMMIKNSSGGISLSVEEYKRPRFETNFLPVEESFKLEDTVKVKGKALTYSGAPLTGSEVKFRVVRTHYFHPGFRFWGIHSFSPKETVIEIGAVKTDDSGHYEISFKAIPDAAIPKTAKPFFNYQIYADVTDISGETRSTSTAVKVGYLALTVNTDIANEVSSLEKLEITVNTNNLNGQFEPAKGSMKISKLKEPERLLRTRLWSKPDKFVIDEKDFSEMFPNDVYSDEDDFLNWKIDRKVFGAKFDTSKEKTIIPQTVSNWDEGKYIVEIETSDKYGEKIEYRQYFELFKPEDGRMTENRLSKIMVLNPTIEPGNDARFLVGSAAKDVTVLFEIERYGKKVEQQIIKLNEEQKIISVPVKESDRGNLGYSIVFQKHGRVFHRSGSIHVPWSNKQLKIKTMSFREKLYPGQKEEWRLKITGSKAEKVAAEMVATLYDQSLDSFVPHGWGISSLYPTHYFYNNWQQNRSHHSSNGALIHQKNWYSYYSAPELNYDSLNYFDLPFFIFYRRHGFVDVMDENNIKRPSGSFLMNRTRSQEAPVMLRSSIATADSVEEESYGIGGMDGDEAPARTVGAPKEADGLDSKSGETTVQIRRNLNETAFFYPKLKTNSKGEIIVFFTIPEALTKWKFMGLAHTQDLKTGIITKETVTQKDLMVMPNIPRFLRVGDSITISTKITSMVDKVLSGKAKLELFDALTLKPVDKELSNDVPVQSFSLKSKGDTVVNWPIKIPMGVSALTWRITAVSGDKGDGEEATIPVLSNRMLVTESLPLPVKGNEKKEFIFKKLVDSGKSNTLVNHKLTLEFTSNPVWYAVQALPYLMEYPYECSEQIFSRFYANSLASHIANSNPNIKKVFDQWKNSDALLSNLQKNEELKSVLLAETPWVLDAQNEEQNKKRVALLFDLNRMGNELGAALKKLGQMQGANGGWPWFEGLPESRYITQHIVSGIGKLNHLKVKEATSARKMAEKGVLFLDNLMRERYEWLKNNKIDLKKENIGNLDIHYLYSRSFFTDVAVAKNNKESFEYWKDQAAKYWNGKSPYINAMSAVALFKLGDSSIPEKIIESLRERAIYNEELGMYYKENMGGYYWYQFPIETQAVIIEAFEEITKDTETVDNLKTWLLKMKQVQNWKTTKATVDAVYALLMGGSDWIKNRENAQITLGDKKVDPVKMGAKTEAGTGYFKVSWSGSEIRPEMGKVAVSNPNSNPAWGALYWQYFEQLDKITPHETPLKLEKAIFKEVQTDIGAVLQPVANNAVLTPGDRLIVRIVLRVDRDMEYIHMKDMRAAGTEPENVLSRHKYQDGLWYYESTKDVSTDFFIERLNKGTFVFEYPLRVNLKGNFSAGITTIQCMYAPEFTSHSEGIRVRVR